MKKTGVMITVTAKGDFGFSPHFGQNIVKGDSYTIDEGEFNPELFEKSSPVLDEPANKNIKSGGDK